jgi:hypothetical protein
MNTAYHLRNTSQHTAASTSRVLMLKVLCHVALNVASFAGVKDENVARPTSLLNCR